MIDGDPEQEIRAAREAGLKPEAALALVQDVPRTQTPGGCWSPAAAMGDALIARLPVEAGVTFNVEG